jgi:hypothetical protein
LLYFSCHRLIRTCFYFTPMAKNKNRHPYYLVGGFLFVVKHEHLLYSACMGTTVVKTVVGLVDAALLLCSGVVLSTIAMMSVMLFDSPGSSEHIPTWAIFWGIVLFCVALEIFCLVRAVKNFRKGKYVRSILVSALPLIPFALLQVLPL